MMKYKLEAVVEILKDDIKLYDGFSHEESCEALEYFYKGKVESLKRVVNMIQTILSEEVKK